MNNTVNIDETIQELNKQNKRIEELCLEAERKDYLLKEQGKELKDLYKEIEKLHSIIKEVREYINNGYLSDGEMVTILAQQELLGILDKVEEK